MKTKLTAILMVVAVVVFAEPSRQSRKLACQLQEAVLRTQDIHMVEELLKQGADVNAPIGCGTFSPLDGAIHTQNVEMLTLLLAHGAKPRGHELANAAFASGHQEALGMAKVLLKAGVDPNARNGYSAPLIQATYRENQDLVVLLLSQRAIKLDETDVDGYTALMWAAKHGSSGIVDLLLHAGANPRIQNKRGETAVAVAEQEIEERRAVISKIKSATK